MARRLALLVAICCACALPSPSSAAVSRAALASTVVVSAPEAALLRHDDRGLYLAFCPGGEEAARIAARPRASAAEANHRAGRRTSA